MIEQGSPKKRKIAQWILLLTSIFVSLINVAWLGMMIYWSGFCPINLTITIVTAAFVVFLYFISLLKLCNITFFRQNATIFTVSLASNYIVYLCWAAMSSNEDCLPYDESINSGAQVVIGALFTFATIISIALAAKDKHKSNKIQTESIASEMVTEDIEGDA